MERPPLAAAAAPRHPDVAAPARPRIVYLYLAIIIATWSANWPMMKLALQHIHPLGFVALRMIGGVTVLAVVLAALRRPLVPLRGERLGLFWVGQFQITLYLVCSILGLAIVPAGRAIVLAYSMPLWALPIGLALAQESLSHRRAVGIAVGFAGLVLFMNPALVDWHDLRVVAGNGLLLLAAISWAIGSCLYRLRHWRSPFWSQTFWQLFAALVVIVPVALVTGAGVAIDWTPGLVAILAYNWVVTTALGYFLWSKALALVPASVAGQVLTLTPVSGFLIAAAIFGGTVTFDIVASIALIVAGLALTLRG